MAVAACLPLIGLPSFNGDGDAAVGAAVFLSGVVGPGADQMRIPGCVHLANDLAQAHGRLSEF